jgi:hypothetical protein
MGALREEIVVLAGRFKVHHFRPLEEHFDGRYAYEESFDPRAVLAHKPELVITFDEHYSELANIVGVARQAGVATLQIMDGILEWRRTWDYTRAGRPIDGRALPLNQPALSHKIACLGRRDARILESWGNAGKCEVVGAPRLDGLLQKRKEGKTRIVPRSGRKARVLVMTAKSPGFTPGQIETTLRSLRDLKQYFTGKDQVDVVWRLTQELHQHLGVSNTLTDLTGGELHDVLLQVDAVVTTPSTAMLEAMLAERPTALLDYHNCPHYFETPWTISAEPNIDPVITELLNPPPARMDYQNFLLGEQLACDGKTASARLIQLIEAMLRFKKEGWDDGKSLPARILEGGELPEEILVGNLRRYYPHLPDLETISARELRMELAAARGTVDTLRDELQATRRRLEKLPGFTLVRKLRKRFRA